MLHKFRIMTLFAGSALLFMAGPAIAADPINVKDDKALLQLEERADSAEDWAELASLWQERAAHFEAKAERHKRLEKRYAAAPKSLLAKRGHGWNTPGRQAQLARSAEQKADQARTTANQLLAKADTETRSVD